MILERIFKKTMLKNNWKLFQLFINFSWESIDLAEKCILEKPHISIFMKKKLILEHMFKNLSIPVNSSFTTAIYIGSAILIFENLTTDWHEWSERLPDTEFYRIERILDWYLINDLSHIPSILHPVQPPYWTCHFEFWKSDCSWKRIIHEWLGKSLDTDFHGNWMNFGLPD